MTLHYLVAGLAALFVLNVLAIVYVGSRAERQIESLRYGVKALDEDLTEEIVDLEKRVGNVERKRHDVDIYSTN